MNYSMDFINDERVANDQRIVDERGFVRVS